MSVIGVDKLTLKISSFNIIKTNCSNKKSETFTNYVIEIKLGKISYTLEKRFSSLYQFHNNLIKIFRQFRTQNKNDNKNSASHFNQLQEKLIKCLKLAFPNKTLFGSKNFKEPFLLKRQEALNAY